MRQATESSPSGTCRAAQVVLGLLGSSTLAQAAERQSGMNLGEIASPVLLGVLVLLIGTGLVAVCMLCQAVFPRAVRLSAPLAGRGVVRNLVYGLLVVTVVTLGMRVGHGLPRPLAACHAMLLLVPFVLLLAVGAAAVSSVLGERVLTGAQSPRMCSDVWAVATGAVLLALINLMPVLGQIAFLLALTVGLGAAFRSVALRAGRRSPPADTDGQQPADAATADGKGQSLGLDGDLPDVHLR